VKQIKNLRSRARWLCSLPVFPPDAFVSIDTSALGSTCHVVRQVGTELAVPLRYLMRGGLPLLRWALRRWCPYPAVGWISSWRPSNPSVTRLASSLVDQPSHSWVSPACSSYSSAGLEFVFIGVQPAAGGILSRILPPLGWRRHRPCPNPRIGWVSSSHRSWAFVWPASSSLALYSPEGAMLSRWASLGGFGPRMVCHITAGFRCSQW